MNRVAISVGYLFCCFTAVLAEDYYVAKPEDLPDWARQGKFHFLRVDGGRMEKNKAVLSHWNLSERNLDVLEGLYDGYAEEMVAYLKQENFNWIWLTWSNGFSLKEESQQREQCRRFIELCHGEGIKVSAYMSAVNMF